MHRPRAARTIEGLQDRWLHQPDLDMMREFLSTLGQFGIVPPELLTGGLDVEFVSDVGVQDQPDEPGSTMWVPTEETRDGLPDDTRGSS